MMSSQNISLSKRSIFMYIFCECFNSMILVHLLPANPSDSRRLIIQLKI